MCLMRTQHWCVTVAACLLITAAGCRNRAPYCQPTCNPNAPFGSIMGPTTVDPPGTYSLQIPGNQNRPYYNSGATAQQLPAVQPTGVNAQNGWQPAYRAVSSEALRLTIQRKSKAGCGNSVLTESFSPWMSNWTTPVHRCWSHTDGLAQRNSISGNASTATLETT